MEEGSAALSKAEAGSDSWGFGVTLEGSGFLGSGYPFWLIVSFGISLHIKFVMLNCRFNFNSFNSNNVYGSKTQQCH